MQWTSPVVGPVVGALALRCSNLKMPHGQKQLQRETVFSQFGWEDHDLGWDTDCEPDLMVQPFIDAPGSEWEGGSLQPGSTNAETRREWRY